MKIHRLFLFIFLLIPAFAFSQEEILGLLLKPSEVPKGWGFPYSHYPVSENANIFYDNYESLFLNQLKGTLVGKKHQSVAGPARGTIYFLNFWKDADMNAIIERAKSFIWEGEAPTPVHPEKIFSVHHENGSTTLVILSFPNEGMAEKIQGIISVKK